MGFDVSWLNQFVGIWKVVDNMGRVVKNEANLGGR
jgi:hypothetical protein